MRTKVHRQSMASSIVILVLSVVMAFGGGLATGYFNGPTRIAPPAPLTLSSLPTPGTSITTPSGQVITAPAGHRVQIYGKEADRGTITSDRLGVSKGGYARGTTAATGLNTQAIAAPALDMTEGREGGTGGMLNSSMKFAAKNSTGALVWVGIALIVAGILCWIFLKLATLGLALVVAGGTLIGIGLLIQTYPWVLLVAVAIVLGIIGYFLYRGWKNKQQTVALTNIVESIESVPASTQKVVKAAIKDATLATQKATKAAVSAIKAKI